MKEKFLASTLVGVLVVGSVVLTSVIKNNGKPFGSFPKLKGVIVVVEK